MVADAFDPDLDDTPASHRALVALSLVPGVGPGRIRSLLARFGSPEAVLDAPAGALANVPGIGPVTAAAIRGFDGFDAVDDQFVRAARLGATLVTGHEPRFPALLRQIFDPPALLWVLGALREEDARAVAIVGTRRATEYGRRVAFELAAGLAERGLTIVSGLAFGIDAAAHRGALEAGGRTLAVLGSGLDRIYPVPHLRLGREIARSGALLSEYPLGAAPDAPNFPRRNRIISGLALGTIVVEAYAAGGALITARMALEQNREVFAVPGSIYSPAAEGANRLIQEGHAKLVRSVDDVLVELGADAATHDAAPARNEPDVEGLGEIERRLFEALDAEPVHIDALCSATGLDPSTVLVYLLGLEFKGLVRQMAGKQFFRSA